MFNSYNLFHIQSLTLTYTAICKTCYCEKKQTAKIGLNKWNHTHHKFKKMEKMKAGDFHAKFSVD